MSEALGNYAELEPSEMRELAEEELKMLNASLAAAEAAPTAAGYQDTYKLEEARARWEAFKAEEHKRKRADSRMEELEQLIRPYQLELDVLREEKAVGERHAARLEHLRTSIQLETEFIAECGAKDEGDED